jgi:hypothetical protein
MAILSYPIFYYKSKIDMLVNFRNDLLKLGITDFDLIEKNIQEKKCFPNTHFTVLVTKVIRKTNNTPPNNVL